MILTFLPRYVIHLKTKSILKLVQTFKETLTLFFIFIILIVLDKTVINVVLTFQFYIDEVYSKKHN